tara:strand:+ start:566 stop:931 length:366 start_codon:yes stop_codon:yes gene_type:complete
MNGIYRTHCDHGNPIYHTDSCPGCRAVKSREQEIRYNEYWKRKTSFFWDYLKEAFKGDIRDPSYKHTIPIEFNGLRRSRSQEELKKEYRKLARKLHPDKGGSTSMFQRLQNLYERLCVSFV